MTFMEHSLVCEYIKGTQLHARYLQVLSKGSKLARMDYNTLVIFPNEKIIVKINSCKELAHRMVHSKPKSYILCPRRL